jgi:hypothetical protein
MSHFNHIRRAGIVWLLLFFGSAGSLCAEALTRAHLDQITRQLNILEKSPGNLRPEQRRAIRAIREILEQRPEKIALTPPPVFEPCKREMIDNNDGTFTFVIETNKEIQRWMLPVNSNEFNRGMTWHDARKTVREYDLNGIRGWILPPAEVLYGIHKVNSDCPGKFAKVTGNPIIRGQFYHFAYWTSNEYSFVDSPEKYHADAVSLYTGNVIHERKENIGIVWPAKLIHTEAVADMQKKELLRD